MFTINDLPGINLEECLKSCMRQFFSAYGLSIVGFHHQDGGFCVMIDQESAYGGSKTSLLRKVYSAEFTVGQFLDMVINDYYEIDRARRVAEKLMKK